MKLSNALAASILMVGAAGLGFFSFQHFSEPASSPIETADIGFTDLAGNAHTLGEWRGKLLLVNFWASWCTPCRKEMPMLQELQTRYQAQGFQIIGPAMDRVEIAERTAKTLGVSYPIYAGDVQIIEAMNALGDQLGALPYSVLLDREGRVLMQQSGELRREILEPLIEKHL